MKLFVEPSCVRPHWVARAAILGVAVLLMSGCTSVRLNVPVVRSHAIADSADTVLGRAFSEQASQNPTLSGFQVVALGHAAFAVRTALADLAERTLDLQYYSAADDLATDVLLLHIGDAADRGVRVRILLDDVHPAARRFARRAGALHPGIQVRLFNPFFWGDSWGPGRVAELVDGERLNRRMHNKLWIADNAAAIVGRRNLGDAYFDASESGNFADIDLLAVGPIVRELSQAFDAYWNSAAAVTAETFGTR
jgi:putative cardiolipin synthase